MHIQGRIGLLALIFTLNQSAYGQTANIPVFSPKDIVTTVAGSPEEIHAFSFWASWCAPCLKEMNLLKSVQTDCDCNLTLHFVNVDEESRKARAIKLATRKNILSQMYFASSTERAFYTQIDDAWNGELPALLLVSSDDKSQFFNSLMTRKKLMRLVSKPDN